MPGGNSSVIASEYPAGHDTRELFDNARVAEALALNPGERVLDIGCGRGGWALLMARRVGANGAVYAFDRRLENVAATRNRAQAQGIGNLHVWRGNAALALPLPDQAIDYCLLCMVLHHLVERDQHIDALAQIHRVLKPGGRLAVVEFEKIEPPPGPPAGLRLARAATRTLVEQAGFVCGDVHAIEMHVYLQSFLR